MAFYQRLKLPRFKVTKRSTCGAVVQNIIGRGLKDNTSLESSNSPEEFLTCNTDFNACHKSIRSFLTCSVCLLMVGSECVWGLGEGSNFQLEGLKIEF